MKYLLFIHIVSILFAYFDGRHDVPAINNFNRYGSNEKDQSAFHGSNWKLKLILCLSLALPPLFWDFSVLSVCRCGITFLVSGINIWMIFDPVVALFRDSKQPWWYLSNGNKTDRVLKKSFGEHAGKWKLFICIVVSILLTVTYILFL